MCVSLSLGRRLSVTENLLGPRLRPGRWGALAGEPNQTQLPSISWFIAVGRAPVAVEAILGRVGVQSRGLDPANSRRCQPGHEIGFQVEMEGAVRPFAKETLIVRIIRRHLRREILADFEIGLGETGADRSSDIFDLG